MTRKPYFLLLATALFFACGGSDHDEAMMKEAHELQEGIIKTFAEVEAMLDAQSTALRDSLEEVLHEMEENLFEIPGYHLELPGHEGHDHGHAQVGLTDEEIVAVHKEMNEQIMDIKAILKKTK